MNISTPIFQVFNYSELNKDLATQGKETYNDFTGFVSHTFNELIKMGGALQNFKDECLNSDKNGKKLFSKWLNSFSSLRHIAVSAMKLYNWFITLNPVRQEYLRTHVQAWKVPALSLLPRLADNIIDEAISRGKKTASQIKQLVARDSKTPVKSSFLSASLQETDNKGAVQEYQNGELVESNCDVELVPGMRVVAKTNNALNGQAGVITKIFRGDQFWVVFDYVDSNGKKTLELLERFELEPEAERVVRAPLAASKKKMYTQEEVQAAVAEALAKKDKEEAELREAKYNESYDAGQKAVNKDMAALEKHVEKLAQEKKQIAGQLQQATQEIQRLQGLHVKNQQLEQRVEDLEKVLEFSNQVSKDLVPLSPRTEEDVKPDFVLLFPVLLSEVQELKGVVSMQEKELAQLQIMNIKQQQEINNGRQYSESNTEIEEIIREFGSLGESLGWNGWNRYGYRAVDGTLHRDVDAIKSFVADLKQEYQEAKEEVVFQN